jgi:trimethylamine:corrinoid methyltransferase-like protein
MLLPAFWRFLVSEIVCEAIKRGEAMDPWNLKGGQLKILSQEEIEEIHQRALDVLQQVGCYFGHQEGLSILEKHGGC